MIKGCGKNCGNPCGSPCLPDSRESEGSQGVYPSPQVSLASPQSAGVPLLPPQFRCACSAETPVGAACCMVLLMCFCWCWSPRTAPKRCGPVPLHVPQPPLRQVFHTVEKLVEIPVEKLVRVDASKVITCYPARFASLTPGPSLCHIPSLALDLAQLLILQEQILTSAPRRSSKGDSGRPSPRKVSPSAPPART